VAGTPIRALLVEDNPSDARLLREILASADPGGYEVQTADCLGEGLRRLEREGRYDVILLDLSLPDSQGLETVSTLQAAVADVPIVVMTGLDDDVSGLEAVRIGAQDYLVKGQTDGRILARTIRYATERKRAEEALRRALDESRRRRAESAALLEAARAVLEHKDFARAAQAIFTSCKNLVGASAGYVAVLSPDRTENEMVYLDSGGLPCTVDPNLPMPIRGLRAEVYRTGQAAFNNEFADSEWMRFMPGGHVRLDNVRPVDRWWEGARAPRAGQQAGRLHRGRCSPECGIWGPGRGRSPQQPHVADTGGQRGAFSIRGADGK
jgi:DNA-binding response OmpR family regulator